MRERRERERGEREGEREREREGGRDWQTDKQVRETYEQSEWTSKNEKTNKTK